MRPSRSRRSNTAGHFGRRVGGGHRRYAAVQHDREVREDARDRGVSTAHAWGSTPGTCCWTSDTPRRMWRSSARPGRSDDRPQARRRRASMCHEGRIRMGMTVVEKILARASGLAAVKAGDVVEPPVDLAMSHENAALVVNQFLEIYQGTGLEPRSGIREGRDHLRPSRSGRVLEDREQPEEGAGVRRPARDPEIPRHPGRRRGHLPPDPAGERLRAAGSGRRRHGLAHDEPRRARSLRLRHRRDGDGQRLDARDRGERRGPGDDQGERDAARSGRSSARRTSSST